MSTKKIIKPLQLFIPITRSERTDDGTALLVEGYAYVNAVVGDGWNLKRSAMEKATADYMEWACIREMHQASAAGTAEGAVTVAGQVIPLGIEWDDKGAYLRAKVVDPVAITKCEEKVYRGFSVGVRPTKARGIDVEECMWIENSLVDRPFDPDSGFTRTVIARRDNSSDADADINADIEVEIFEEGELIPGEEPSTPTETEIPPAQETVIRGLFQTYVGKRENYRLRCLAWDVLSDVLCTILNDPNVTDVEKAVREAIGEFGDYITPLIVSARAASDAAQAVMPDELYYAAGMQGDAMVTRLTDVTRAEIAGRAELARVIAERDTRVEALTSERDAAIERGKTLETEKSTLQTDLTAKIEEKDKEITRLNNLPDPRQNKPVRTHGAALEREFPTNPVNQEVADTATLARAEAIDAEIKRLQEELPKDPDETVRQNGVARMLQLKQERSLLP